MLADPIAAWDELEAGITFLEEEIHAANPSYTVTPFVAGTRTSTWVMTKAEIQGLEDRMHAVSEFLKIPHLRTVWSGLMPVNYNALNHFILGLAPEEWIANGYDIDGSLWNIMPIDYNLSGIDWLDMFRGGTPTDDLTDLINGQIIDNHAEWIYIKDLYQSGDDWCYTVVMHFTNDVILSPGQESHFATGGTITVLNSPEKDNDIEMLIVYPSYQSTVNVVYDGDGSLGDFTTASPIPAFDLTYTIAPCVIDYVNPVYVDETTRRYTIILMFGNEISVGASQIEHYHIDGLGGSYNPTIETVARTGVGELTIVGCLNAYVRTLSVSYDGIGDLTDMVTELPVPEFFLLKDMPR